MPHELKIRVYYEDTDLAGIVYYANYLKFIERGRSEMLRAYGIDQAALRDNNGIVFAVRRVEADYLRVAKFDDMLTVTTSVERITGARIVLHQVVSCENITIFCAVVTIVALDKSGAAARLPVAVSDILANPSV